MKPRFSQSNSPEDRAPPSERLGLVAPTKDGGANKKKRKENKAVAVEEVHIEKRASSLDIALSTVRKSSRPGIWRSASDKPTMSISPDITPTYQDLSNAMAASATNRRARLRSPWSCSPLTLASTALAAVIAFVMIQSFLTRQRDPKGCAMSYMRPAFAKFSDFDTEHTRFASKYSLYLYREVGVDEDTRVKGIPVLFIPGNAGSYKQIRPIAAEAAVHFQETLQGSQEATRNGKRPLDFFSVDLNEDITAFHGQTLLDQAEYLNEAIAYILSLYHNPSRSVRDRDLPDPTSVILIGHSMGGIVARTMLTMSNYQSNSINTIITLSAPHARAPVSFDTAIVHTYQHINEYWRQAYSQKWANQNPLWHVTLISIAGGGLDTVVPSDYSAIASLVPPTHGFTVFTSTIPSVWTGMDHLSITWCDQLRKILVRALYDVADAGRPSQTRPRAERMRAFKKWFLTGMEDVAERTLTRKEPKTLLTLEDNSNAISSQGERLILRHLGRMRKHEAHLLPIPPQASPDRKRFTLLTDHTLDPMGGSGVLEVLFCNVFPLHAGHSSTVFSMNMDLSGDSPGTTRLACKNAASDAILLPASTRNSKHSFDDTPPFSYLQYDLEDLYEYQFVAVIDKAVEPTRGWVCAEFSSRADSIIHTGASLRGLVMSGLDVITPFDGPMVVEIKIPPASSSLLAYRLSIGKQSCGDESELFTPLLRQYISEPYESKYFVNVKETEISMHGVAPYMPPALKAINEVQGLSLQIWSDPTCHNTMDISLRVDVLGSMGKLWMRYRTVFAAFPLLVVALVIRKQFAFYNDQGIFMSFSEGMDQCLRKSIPLLLLALTLFGMSVGRAKDATTSLAMNGLFHWGGNATETAIDFTKNDLLLGSSDPFFWFLIPLFGLISVGVCITLNYLVLSITHIGAFAFSRITKLIWKTTDGRNNHTFAVTSLRKRIITTSILLFLVSTVIPYQFVFIVLCVVQIATCIRALSLARETHAAANLNFYNYVHSILVLMLWILPINLPVLVVWIHNIAVHWLTPFSSHHNILSIMPFVILIETLSTGKMVPRVASRVRHLTSILFFGLAVYAAVYGVTYAYLLHFIVNIVCAWLVGVHFSSGSFSFSGITQMMESNAEEVQDVKKRP